MTLNRYVDLVGYPKVRCGVKFIDVDGALDLLETSLEHEQGGAYIRNIHDSHVLGHQQNIDSGKFVLSPDCVAIDENDHLFNGQHRLWAVVESGKGQWFLVAENMPTNSRYGTNKGRAETLNEQLRLLYPHLEIKRNTVKCVRAFYESPDTRIQWSEEKLYEGLSQIRDAVDFVVKGIGSTPKVNIHGVVGACVRAYYHVPHKILGTFMEILKTAKTEEDCYTNVVLRVRDRLLTGKGMNPVAGGSAKRYAYFLTSKCLLMFMKGTSGKVVAIEKDPFPIPREQEIELLRYGNKRVFDRKRELLQDNPKEAKEVLKRSENLHTGENRAEKTVPTRKVPSRSRR